MNSIIEAQQEFSNCFGELTLRHVTSGDLILPEFSREAMELDAFIDEHQDPAPVEMPVTISHGIGFRRYNFLT